jgi:opine dehydrogenase
MNVAIIGAGAVALSSAALMTKNGHRACLWSALPEEIQSLKSERLVTCEGELSGTFAIEVTDTVEQCMAQVDVVMIAAPAFAHRALMAACAPFIQRHHMIVMNTATGFSSLYFARLLADRQLKPTFVDLGTTVCAARVTGPGRVRLGPPKPDVDLATMPAARGEAGWASLTELFGDFFGLRRSVLAVALNNHNPIYHVPALVFNLARAELGEVWNIWRNLPPFVARYVEKLDQERLSVAARFGVEGIPLTVYLRSSIGLEGDDLAGLFAAAAAKRPAPTGPKSVDDRYMTEDMPYGMVFFRKLGEAGGVAMPVTDHLIDFCNDLYNRDFRSEGLGLDDLDLANRSPAEIVRLAQDGF